MDKRKQRAILLEKRKEEMEILAENGYKMEEIGIIFNITKANVSRIIGKKRNKVLTK